MAIKAVREVSPWTLGSGAKFWEMISWPRWLVFTLRVLKSLFFFLIFAVKHYIVSLAVVLAVAGIVEFKSLFGTVLGVIPP